MKACKLTISVALACAYLGGSASAETPAPASALTQAAPSGSGKAFLEDDPEKLKAFSCEALGNAMASNYGLACFLESSERAFDKIVGAASGRKFKVQQKEYKSRCKGEPAKLTEAKRSLIRKPCKSLPSA
jgi:hypothetical protein